MDNEKKESKILKDGIVEKVLTDAKKAVIRDLSQKGLSVGIIERLTGFCRKDIEEILENNKG